MEQEFGASSLEATTGLSSASPIEPQASRPKASIPCGHTPGPWKANARLTIEDANGEFIADAAQIEFGEDGEYSLDTAEPNARLIAAAPDYHSAASKLLAAFDELQATTTAERIITGRSDRDLRKASNEALAELRAAHARATGAA